MDGASHGFIHFTAFVNVDQPVGSYNVVPSLYLGTNEIEMPVAAFVKSVEDIVKAGGEAVVRAIPVWDVGNVATYWI